VRRLTLSLDALPGLREATHSDVDLSAAATLAELAGVDAVRLGVSEDRKPVRPEDVLEARRAARALELRMAPSQGLLKLALEVRPDRVLLAGDGRDGRSPAGPLDLRRRALPLGPVLRVLGEAGIPAAALIAPDLEAVKAAHAEQLTRVELFTASLVDLPAPERAAELEKLSDAARMAAKLRMEVAVGGGLGYRNLGEVLEAAPAAGRVAVGRAAMARAVLVGLDRALRDLRSLVS
jgi:pyridoxine 5-phosphate synthase